MGTVKLIDILKIINRDNSIIIKDNGTWFLKVWLKIL